MVQSRMLHIASCVVVLAGGWLGLGRLSQAAAPVSFSANFTSAGSAIPMKYRAWLPDGFERIKGLIFSLPGTNGDRGGITSNTAWQYRATQMGYGLVGFKDPSYPYFDFWGTSSEEVHDNLQMVLDSIAQAFAHEEISNAPVFLDGISKGAFVAGNLASFAPERTLGFIADKGYSVGSLDSSTYHAPGAIIAGAKDAAVPPDYLSQSFYTTRQLVGAHTAFMVDWNVGHQEAPENLRFALMDQMIRARYPKGQFPSTTRGNPLQLLEPSGWLAEAAQLDELGMLVHNPEPLIAPEDSYPLDPSQASWLPTKTATEIYWYLNDRTFPIKPVSLTVVSPFYGEVVMDVAVNLIESHSLRLYLEEELIGQFDPSAGPIHFTYRAKENGLHTFLAIAEYDDGGITKTTSNFVATFVQGVVVPEPAGFGLALLAGIFSPFRVRLSLWG